MKQMLKVRSLYPPTVINTINGRFAVFGGSGGSTGWHKVDNSFTLEDALAMWEKMEMSVSTATDSVTSSKAPVREWRVLNSKGNGTYVVKHGPSGWDCTCTGFGFRRDCKHVQLMKKQNN